VLRLASSSCFVLGSIAVASLAPRAGAQSANLYPELSLASANAAQDAAKPSIPEKPREDLQLPQKDVFQAKTVEVKAGELKEEQPVGEYDQPVWSTFRRFPSTRVYLQTPPGGAQFEQWIQMRNPKDNSNAETRLSQELEFGLGHRMQLDLYMNELHVRDGVNSTYNWSGYSMELRYALADWDQIWGNPTLYLEYLFNDQNHDGADGIEPKLLFGGEIATGWHWGVNFAHERTFAGSNDVVSETSYFGSISYTIVDSAFSVGASSEVTYEGAPSDPAPPPGAPASRDHGVAVYLGPSFQLIPHPRASLSLEPLWGLTGSSLRSKTFIVFTWHF
jgi:hypothetical protein